MIPGYPFAPLLFDMSPPEMSGAQSKSSVARAVRVALRAQRDPARHAKESAPSRVTSGASETACTNGRNNADSNGSRLKKGKER